MEYPYAHAATLQPGPGDEARVRKLIEAALRGGTCVGLDGRTSTSTVASSGPVDEATEEGG